MLKPSIDTLLDKVPSKYSLVILEAKRAHELEAGAPATQGFKSEKSTLRALEEIESGNVTIHPDPEGKREAVRRRIEEEKRRKEEEEKKIKEQIAKEKKMVKKFKVGGLNLIFLLQECADKEEVRRWP
ncbi:DNA-directed RNA polymerase, omega subunit [Streptococcus pneumoniae GA13723]|nr:DNA-directed RNA polymerase, omega subunit [Streptococcus pneumoniae GA13723]